MVFKRIFSKDKIVFFVVNLIQMDQSMEADSIGTVA
jgi:hypothetical protein